jgi:hypothetical protein
MSLLNTASPWTTDDSSKKRQSTMRKTFKLKTNSNVDGVDLDSKIESPGEYVSNVEEYQRSASDNKTTAPPTIEETQASMQDRNVRVNDLLNKITAVDEGSKLGAFTPLPNPNMTVKKEDSSTGLTHPLPPPYSMHPANLKKTGNFSANDGYVSNLSNYRNSYESAPVFKREADNIPARPVVDNKLMEKINYMIHILEEQQHEKTSNITEEFILYTFLGVFIIFVVDSFSRSGKYTR